MQTLPEFLNDEENQNIVLEKIIEALRVRGEWGQHGVFTRIGKQTGFTPAYVGQVFGRSKPLRENFVVKMGEYLGVSAHWLCGNPQLPDGVKNLSYEEEIERLRKLGLAWDEMLSAHKTTQRELTTLGKMVNYKRLVDAFLAIPANNQSEGLEVLRVFEKYGQKLSVEYYEQHFGEGSFQKSVDQYLKTITPPPAEEG